MILICFVKIKIKYFNVFIFPFYLLLFATVFFVFYNQEGYIFQTFINLFGFFRGAIIFILVFYLLDTDKVSRETLFYCVLFSFFILLLIGFIQSLSPSLNNFINSLYGSTYKKELLTAISSQENYRLTSSVGHPSGLGLVALITVAIAYNTLKLSKVGLHKLVFFSTLLFACYMGIISGSKVFYMGFLIYFVYVLANKKTILVLILAMVLLFFYLGELIFYIDNFQLTYIYQLITSDGFFAILETRFGSNGLLTEETLPFLLNTYFLGSGLFDSENAFYGDSLYLVLVLRFSFIGLLVFLCYFLYFIYKLPKLVRMRNDPVLLGISHVFFLILIAGIGYPTFFSARVFELLCILWAIGVYSIYYGRIKKYENLTCYT